MNLVIHRGSNQIGGSCVEVESQGGRLLIDLGLPLDAEGDPRQFLPAVSGLDGKDASLLGILISHPHQDHFGLLSQISPDVRIGMGAAARRILTAAAPFIRDRLPPPVSGWNFGHEKPLQIGPFTVTPYLVDHSAYDSYALLIEADGKRVFYSGDFRAHGRKSKLFESIIENPPKKIAVLLLEGSSIGRLQDGEIFPTEQEMEAEFIKAFVATKGLALVHASAQNIDRIVSIFRACKQTGRTMVIDLYAAAILKATGNLKLPQSSWGGVALFLPKSQRVKVKKEGWFDQLKQHSSHRIYMRQIDLESSDSLAGASYIYSQWEGYWEKKDFDEVKALLLRHNIQEHHIHTSGHAGPADLQKFAKALNPRKTVPIHSFMPEKYTDLFPNVEIHVDGERWKVE
jgi:ribonuclease J